MNAAKKPKVSFKQESYLHDPRAIRGTQPRHRTNCLTEIGNWRICSISTFSTAREDLKALGLR